MNPWEAILMRGARRYSNYTGYANTTKFSGKFEDSMVEKLDAEGRIDWTFSAIDAVHFNYYDMKDL